MPDATPRPEPFILQTAPTALENLRVRLRATRWPDAPQDAGWSLGFEEPELYAEELREFFRPYRAAATD
jgi:hypothetical protein